MHAHKVVLEVVRRGAALQVFPEGLVTVALEQRNHVIIFQPSLAGKAGNVAHKATWVVAEAITRAKILVGIQCNAFRCGKQRAKIDSPILEGSRGYAATTWAMRNLYLGIAV
jgi:hypothetical protein